MGVIILGGSSGVGQDVDADKNAVVQVRSPAFGALGYYQVATVTGQIAATLAAASPLFSLRWGDATRLCLVRRIRVGAVVGATITAAVAFDLDVIFARAFTASDTGGTAMIPFAPTGSQKLRTSMGTTLMTDMRIAATAALGAGTRTLDGLALGRVSGNSGTVVGTQFFSGGMQTLFDRTQPGFYPAILAQNEGLVVRNPLAGPATGTFNLVIEVEWGEVAAY